MDYGGVLLLVRFPTRFSTGTGVVGGKQNGNPSTVLRKAHSLGQPICDSYLLAPGNRFCGEIHLPFLSVLFVSTSSKQK